MIPRIGTGFPLADRANKAVSADLSISASTTLANVPELSFTLSPNEVWVANLALDVGAALATTGIKVALVVPSGATINFAAGLIPSAYAAANLGSLRTTTGGTALDWVIATQTGVASAQIVGQIWVRNGSTAGLAQIQAAQSTSSATALLIRAGSFLTAQRVA
jgi:hypothetical protein